MGPLGTHLSEILIEILTFYPRKCVWKCRLRNGGHFVCILYERVIETEMSLKKFSSRAAQEIVTESPFPWLHGVTALLAYNAYADRIVNI